MKKESIAKIILEKLVDGLIIWLEAFEWPYWKRYDYSDETIKRTIYRLKKEELLEIKKKGRNRIIKITKKGEKQVLKYKLEKLQVKKPRVWDRKWRIVIFDIPEKKRIARDVLREKLISLGFVKIQRSVFIHPYDCKKEIDFIKEVYEINPYVRFVIADFIEDQEYFLQKFNL
jgi:DNA-binding transcriptional regulator PaaX